MKKNLSHFIMEKLFFPWATETFFSLCLFSFVFCGKWKRLCFDASASGLGRGVECWVSEVDLARLEGDLYLFSLWWRFLFSLHLLGGLPRLTGLSGSSSLHSSLIDVHDLKI